MIQKYPEFSKAKIWNSILKNIRKIKREQRKYVVSFVQKRANELGQKIYFQKRMPRLFHAINPDSVRRV